MRKTITGLIMDYFRRYDCQDLYIGPVLDRATKEYFKIYHSKPYDSLKAVNALVEQGKLTMIKEGVYRYDPAVNKPSDE